MEMKRRWRCLRARRHTREDEGFSFRARRCVPYRPCTVPDSLETPSVLAAARSDVPGQVTRPRAVTPALRSVRYGRLGRAEIDFHISCWPVLLATSRPERSSFFYFGYYPYR